MKDGILARLGLPEHVSSAIRSAASDSGLKPLDIVRLWLAEKAKAYEQSISTPQEN